jgi:hypothetical protein
MGAGLPRDGRADRVDQPLEGRALLVIGERPPDLIDELVALVDPAEANEVFATALAREGIALEVQEQIARRRFRQQPQAEGVAGRQQLIGRST